MYGYEAVTGLGGLAAQAPPNPRLASTLQIRSPGAMIIGDPTTGAGEGQVLPFSLSNGPAGGPVAVSWTGGAVTQDPSNALSSWRQILDWHNSPAPWVLLLILAVYGYVHVSYRRGRAAVGGGFT